MKHTNKSASCFEFACPHLSDHRTQKAKPNSKNNRGTSVPSVFLSFGAQPLTRYHNLTSSKHVNPGKKTRKNTRNNTLKSPKNTQNTQKNTFIFLRGNVDSHPYFPNSIPATYPPRKTHKLTHKTHKLTRTNIQKPL